LKIPLLKMSSSSTTACQGQNAAQAGTASMYILAIAAFVIVTTEFLMVGLLPALCSRSVDFHRYGRPTGHLAFQGM
jgi:hypothetical protein